MFVQSLSELVRFTKLLKDGNKNYLLSKAQQWKVTPVHVLFQFSPHENIKSDYPMSLYL